MTSSMSGEVVVDKVVVDRVDRESDRVRQSSDMVEV